MYHCLDGDRHGRELAVYPSPDIEASVLLLDRQLHQHHRGGHGDDDFRRHHEAGHAASRVRRPRRCLSSLAHSGLNLCPRIPRRLQHGLRICRPPCLLHLHLRVEEPARLPQGAGIPPGQRHLHVPDRHGRHLLLHWRPSRQPSTEQRDPGRLQGRMGHRDPHHHHCGRGQRPRVRQVHLRAAAPAPRRRAHAPADVEVARHLDRAGLHLVDRRVADRRGRARLQRHARHHQRPLRQLVHLWPQRHVLVLHEHLPWTRLVSAPLLRGAAVAVMAGFVEEGLALPRQRPPRHHGSHPLRRRPLRQRQEHDRARRDQETF